MKLARTYLLLTALATPFNAATRNVFAPLCAGPYGPVVAVGIGAGLVRRYAHDRRHIFRFGAGNPAREFRPAAA